MTIERLNNFLPESLKNFENSEQMKRVNDILIGYLAENPPSLGHGYSHFKKVARDCYLLGEKNGIERLDLMYLSGLCHDIYRPAEGKGGKEDHETRGGEIIRDRFGLVLPQNDLDLVVLTIVDHDKAIIEGRGTEMMKILSLTDKSDMSAQRCIAYTWASNKNCNPDKLITSFNGILDFFRRYRSKADKIFEYIGLDASLNNQVYRDKANQIYNITEDQLASLLGQEERGEIEFNKQLIEISKREAELDVDYLQENDSSEVIDMITANYGELLVA